MTKWFYINAAGDVAPFGNEEPCVCSDEIHLKKVSFEDFPFSDKDIENAENTIHHECGYIWISANTEIARWVINHSSVETVKEEEQND